MFTLLYLTLQEKHFGEADRGGVATEIVAVTGLTNRVMEVVDKSALK